MRRLVTLLIFALLGATVYGFASPSTGLAVNGTTVTNSTFRGELSAISAAPNLDCFISALDPATYTAGAGGASVPTSGAAVWANLRIEGLALQQYAQTTLKYHPRAKDLAAAKASLLSELSQADQNRVSQSGSQYTCPGSSAMALADMPNEMRTFEIAAQAASLRIVATLKKTVPLTATSMKTYYAAHTSEYDTICVSIALVPPAQVAAFQSAEATGLSVAALAKKYSTDASGQKGGAYGCFAPSSTSYSGVRSDTISTALNTFPKTPQYISLNGATDALFVAPTKRTVTPFATAESSVLSDLETANASLANTLKGKILFYSAISVDPAFGRWGLNTTGPSTFVPGLPPKADVGTTSMIAALTTAGTATYK
ncbi:MAG TPA: peptidylprolyl isomerase [Acidimicrobiales bacterium]